MPRIFRKGRLGIAFRVSSDKWTAASPMISMRRTTASCFSVFAAESASLMSLTYAPISWEAVRISRSRPSWSACIYANRRGQDILAREAIRRLLQGATQDKIDRSADQFLGLSGHFQQVAG